MKVNKIKGNMKLEFSQIKKGGTKMKEKIRKFIKSIDLSEVSIVYIAIVSAFYNFFGVKIPDIIFCIITFVLVTILCLQVIWTNNKENKKGGNK
jgi:hypothetical protein